MTLHPHKSKSSLPTTGNFRYVESHFIFSPYHTVAHTEAFCLDDLEDMGSLDGMRVGSLTGGFIGPFSSLKLEIIFQPTIPGKVDVDFEVRFDDPLSEIVSIKNS